MLVFVLFPAGTREVALWQMEQMVLRTRKNEHSIISKVHSEYLTSKVFLLFFCKFFLQEAGRLSNSIDAMDPLSFQNGVSSKRNLGLFAPSLGGDTVCSSKRPFLAARILARRLRGTLEGFASNGSGAAGDSVSSIIFSRSLVLRESSIPFMCLFQGS